MQFKIMNTYYDIPLGIIFMSIPFIILAFAIIYNFTPEKQASDQAWQKQYDSLTLKISKMDCKQLQQIRLDSIAGKPFTESYGSHWGQIRDTYNALSCGNHWGLFED